jgi:hypothetical protein
MICFSDPGSRRLLSRPFSTTDDLPLLYSRVARFVCSNETYALVVYVSGMTGSAAPLRGQFINARSFRNCQTARKKFTGLL